MITSTQPTGNPNNSLQERIRLFLQRLITPHPLLSNQGERRSAQLLAALSLVSIMFALLGGIVSGSYGIFLALAVLAFVTYLLSRTKFYYVGAYLFTYSLTSIAYIRILLGSASSIDTAISTTVYISLILASALLPQTGFVLLALLSTIATFPYIHTFLQIRSTILR
jgi:hypothetical protein